MAQHLLAVLRLSVGLSHAGYAQLVADTHAALGFGPLVARREKVSRWESGRTVPSPTAQLAIAEIHGVPEAEVLRLGWPVWLSVAMRADSVSEGPWSPLGAVDAARALTGTSDDRSAFPLLLTSRGPALVALLKGALAALEHPQPAPAQDGHAVSPESLDWIECRVRALERQEAGSPVTPSALYHATRAEYRLVTGLLTGSGYDRRTAARLLYLVARTTRLLACLSTCLGDFATAERYSLASLRAATAVGARRQSVVSLADLAGLHAVVGAPRDALSVLSAARSTSPRLAPRLAALVDSWEALALARTGEKSSSVRVLDRAGQTLSNSQRQPAVADGLPVQDLDDMRLRLCTGLSLLYQDQHAEALKWLVPLTDAQAAVGPDGPTPSPFTAGILLYAVDAQLALGDLDSAVHSTRYASALAGGLPRALDREYRRRFAPHRGEPLVQELLGLLSGPRSGT
ncbi:helix-turn-helix domain-containing protein [Streptomyces aureoverticillatus]|uniref:helix-turn-helix domain-containing protein n=1 Tax=Streptomyces aureoverticillatus TaxID=66871 RepID=UPI0013DB02EC|nr:helix-turn-helix domain-containing protein [Streptomyces aureoverticillatus]QIB42673.1 hypothetical protein G3H79_05925 [Streptomyces aureoverticillatus]